MSPPAALALMMNNYLHDVATALLAASGAAMWILYRRFDPADGEGAARLFLGMHRGMTRLARVSLAWIVLGGIPRTIFYMEFEWANAVGRLQVPALILKHVLAFAFVGAGVYLWVKLDSRVKAIRAAA
jgi:hypothetical protein